MIAFAIPVYMALAFRNHGGMPPKLPRGLKNFLCAWPYALPLLHSPVLAIIAVAFAMAGKATGHGQYLDLGTWRTKADAEKLDFIVRIFCGEDNGRDYWRDFCGLIVTGMAVTLIPGVILTFSNPIAGVFLAMSGAFKGPAYAIGWKIYPEGQGRGIPQLNQATQIGEALTGLFTGVALAFCLL